MKDVLVLHHSHLDMGYTHSGVIINELQKDFIEMAISLCEETECLAEDRRFRWTCEATQPVMEWLKTASPQSIDKFERFLHNGQMSIAALPFHAAPMCTPEQMLDMLRPVKCLNDRFGIRIRTAISHDVNGQPWSLSQMLLDSGIDFYITGINMHFGGIPFPRPLVFRWETPDERSLLTYHGEHYSLFSQFCETRLMDTDLMQKGLEHYDRHLTQTGCPYDFIYLTATNPPAYDNNPPDIELHRLFERFNSENRPYKLQFVTPEMLLERVRGISDALIPTHAGDWTDFWNFGAASTAQEVKLNRAAKRNIKSAELLESVQAPISLSYSRAKEDALMNVNCFDEHTWGSAWSVSAPYSQETFAQYMVKSAFAHKGADLSAYVLNKQLEQLAGNRAQGEKVDGGLLLNPTDVKQDIALCIPNNLLSSERNLYVHHLRNNVPYIKDSLDTTYFGIVPMEPFSYRTIDASNLKQMLENQAQPKSTFADGLIHTPFFAMRYDMQTGRILSLIELAHNWEMLDQSSDYTFFELIRESIDPAKQMEVRESMYPRDVEKANLSSSCWNNDWSAKREGVDRVIGFQTVFEADGISFVFEASAKGISYMKQTIHFSDHHDRIGLSVQLDKDDVSTPESIYFAFPLNMAKGWECIFDSMGRFAKLDDEQLGTCSKDWVTVEQTVSMHDDVHGVTLACPDAPLVQVGGFRFGKESKSVERNRNPLLLAWPMNNYWNTNFRASQPGTVRLYYELTPFTQFNASDAYERGVLAQKHYEIINIAEMNDERLERLVQVDTDDFVRALYVKPGENQSILLLLNNIGDEDGTARLSIPGRTIRSIQRLNFLEEAVEEMRVNGRQGKVQIRPKAFLLVKITLD